MTARQTHHASTRPLFGALLTALLFTGCALDASGGLGSEQQALNEERAIYRCELDDGVYGVRSASFPEIEGATCEEVEGPVAVPEDQLVFLEQWMADRIDEGSDDPPGAGMSDSISVELWNWNWNDPWSFLECPNIDVIIEATVACTLPDGSAGVKTVRSEWWVYQERTAFGCLPTEPIGAPNWVEETECRPTAGSGGSELPR